MIMKTLFRIISVTLVSFFIFSCISRTRHVHSVHHVPPGQAKKIMKSKSAKPYAPGQLKKNKKHKSGKPLKRPKR